MSISVVFSPATDAEREIERCSQNRFPIVIGSSLSIEQSSVRADFLRDILTRKAIAGSSSGPFVSPMKITGAWIKGRLELSELGSGGSPLPYLHFTNCLFSGGINLDGSFIGCLQIESSIVLDDHNSRSGTWLAISAKNAHLGAGATFRKVQFEGAALIDLGQTSVAGNVIFDQIVSGLDAMALPERFGHAEVAGRLLSSRQALQQAGDQVACHPNSNEVARVVLKGATVGGNLSFLGTTIHIPKQGVYDTDGTKLTVAIDADGASIAGDVEIKASNEFPCDIFGEIYFQGAKIEGQLVVKGAQLNCNEGESALSVEGAVIKSDFFLRPDNGEGRCHPCAITGEVDLIGATVGGQFWVEATISAPEWSILADGATIKGGVLIWSREDSRCILSGGIHLLHTTIEGRLDIRGVILSAQDASAEGVKHDEAIFADGAQISRGIKIARDKHWACEIHGRIRLVGATLGGGLEFIGTEVTPREGAALVAHGAIIRGGISFSPYEDPRAPCVIAGDLQLNGATVDGAFALHGVRLTAGASGLAASAVNANFKSDFSVYPDKELPSVIVGELRLCGAMIAGNLQLVGTTMQTGSTGYVIDCYTAEISKEVLIVQTCDSLEALSQSNVATRLEGIVGFAAARASALTFGSEWPDKTEDPGVYLTGNLRLNQIQVKGRSVFNGIKLRPSSELAQERRAWVESAMDRWGTNPCSILSAHHADFGTEMEVNIAHNSGGVINLYGAKAGTLRDTDATGWGYVRTSQKQHNGQTEWVGVQLELDGFTYERLPYEHAEALKPGHERLKNSLSAMVLSPLKAVIGYPVSPRIAARVQWLRQQYPNGKPAPPTFFPHAYRQLSKVCRSQGDLLEANEFARIRRWNQLCFGSDNFAHRVIEACYGFFFGFGYSSVRAFLSLLLLFGLSLIFTWKAFSPPISAGQTTWLHQISSHMDPGTPAQPCPIHRSVYALDLMLPVVHIGPTPGCALSENAPRRLEILRILILVLSGIFVPTAVVTFSGLLRENNT